MANVEGRYIPKGFKYQTSKYGKVTTKDGNFKDISPVKKNPQCPYTNPAKANNTMVGTEQIKGKLGK
jgi:hypothetical protein